jgi:hypothetical protein
MDASKYAINVVLTQHGHPMDYNSETLSNTIWRYPTYGKDMYSIVQAHQKWKDYKKETIIHIDYKPP